MVDTVALQCIHRAGAFATRHGPLLAATPEASAAKRHAEFMRWTSGLWGLSLLTCVGALVALAKVVKIGPRGKTIGAAQRAKLSARA
jgi:hypothetical protein